MNSFSRTPKPRCEIARWTGGGSSGVNLTVLDLSVPRGRVTIRESAWNSSFVVDFRVIDFCWEEGLISMEVISVLNWIKFCDFAG